MVPNSRAISVYRRSAADCVAGGAHGSKAGAPDSASVAHLATFPIPRCWFLDGSKNQLLQLQSDRFLRNWRQIDGHESYPRYGSLIQEFQREWDDFLAFISTEGIDRPTVNQCEMTYINNLPRGVGWQDFSELGKVFTPLRARKEVGFLPPPEVFAWDTVYNLPDNRGRLRINMQPAFRGRDLKMILSLDLTARGRRLLIPRGPSSLGSPSRTNGSLERLTNSRTQKCIKRGARSHD